MGVTAGGAERRRRQMCAGEGRWGFPARRESCTGHLDHCGVVCPRSFLQVCGPEERFQLESYCFESLLPFLDNSMPLFHFSPRACPWALTQAALVHSTAKLHPGPTKPAPPFFFFILRVKKLTRLASKLWSFCLSRNHHLWFCIFIERCFKTIFFLF